MSVVLVSSEVTVFAVFCVRLAAPSGTVESSSGCCGDVSLSEEAMRISAIESSFDCVRGESILLLVSFSVCVGLNCVSSKVTFFL